eukprot:PLAT4404.1.p1 GENE.PLAT4404.1~~PLAT4404.1.p1  ORF type:complete len:311 (+),score=140.79 PLAT4404.1:112-1044(+)
MSHRRQKSFRKRPIDVHKPLPLFRTEELEFEDESGVVMRVSAVDGGDGAATEAHAKKKLIIDIPTPVCDAVEDYSAIVSPTFKLPSSYIRTQAGLVPEEGPLEYDADVADELWLKSHPKLGVAGSGGGEPLLSLDGLERAIDAMEKASGTKGSELTQVEATNVLSARLPEWSRLGSKLVAEVHAYWLQKRTRLSKPLLRRFWPATSSNDTNPHLVFRPREKERYKLRKHRKNDMESFEKLQQLRRDCDRARQLLDVVRQREIVKKQQLLLQEEVFKQAVYDLTDSSGRRRKSKYSRGDQAARACAAAASW